MILKSIIRDVNGSGAVVEREWSMSGVKWSISGAGVGLEWGIFLFYIAIFKNKNKRIFVPYGFQQVFNIQIYTKYIQHTNTYKYSFQHFNIVFNKF